MKPTHAGSRHDRVAKGTAATRARMKANRPKVGSVDTIAKAPVNHGTPNIERFEEIS
jgi:hypothetical protein